MKPVDIPVDGGVLRALRWGEGPNVIVAAHGITASAMAFAAVARELPPEWSLVSLDLRGRGDSNGLPGPFGMDQHARDIHAVAGFLNAGKVVLTGQSMGAYAALRASVTKPDLFSHLVLIDGGLPLPVPPEVDPDLILEATVGPAIARLSQTFATDESYLDFFRAHPALADSWSEDIEAYVRYDLAGPVGAHKSKANPLGVREDGRDLIVNAASFGDDLMRLEIPALLLHAPRGMLGQEGGLLPQPLVEHWGATAPRLRTELVPDTNHYTILMTSAAAVTLAQRLTDPSSWR
ncbi:MAG TPA: alpha/beta hydrolase [Micromonosporaceae bacterium]|nr:alpha/beta hydrolase [Micromonosporaceae bacterium]HCU50955.1 alpha/beta hydrolase [Micromonosporaceae bacterium]